MEDQAQKKDFLTLIEENKGIIIKICNSYCRDLNDREDLTQEIIYALWKSGNNFKGQSKFSTWMYRVALNVAISSYRKKEKSNAVIPLNTSHIDIEDKIDDAEETEKKVVHLQQLINEMKELDRALTLLYFEEKSYQEIAEILGISETNVATRINRIKIKLKQKFSTINN
ncbi:MAG: sigma-70 family RNA polymerase sigma factor [Bacteroidetes bacterium]|nr:sigma-70 family RNA polymerase sigma factor [Bacteroidota bacterium]